MNGKSWFTVDTDVNGDEVWKPTKIHAFASLSSYQGEEGEWLEPYYTRTKCGRVLQVGCLVAREGEVDCKKCLMAKQGAPA